MKYYLINQNGAIEAVIPSDARNSYRRAAQDLLDRKIPFIEIDKKIYVRAVGVIG